MIFVNGVYHADPHPGNIFVANDGAIVFVDFGAVGVLAPAYARGDPGVLRRRHPPRRASDHRRAFARMGFVARDAEERPTLRNA